jgi:hypothetical protein
VQRTEISPDFCRDKVAKVQQVPLGSCAAYKLYIALNATSLVSLENAQRIQTSLSICQLGRTSMMRIASFSAALVLSSVGSAHAGLPAADQLGSLVTTIIQCTAQKSIWLQGASFKTANLQVQAAGEPGGFSFSAELTTIYAGGQKQEKSTVKGLGSNGAALKLSGVQLTDDEGETRDVHASCLN